ncbi:Uma2 family endonuclease [Oharaeibacter diazotrophicus]|uniref:Uma2 family endonuclease n=1 Tax=Oharaeibacter diazotrophicus TaxID=1920512 RepID=A0A4R6RLA8_9HYPH|nr:Uma2 family endonuclease [Oharaeibacter diazotrophicus]TDP87423.1 Uma2 family endonuclease [Oharaeibacter diazotrophicus]BBE70633.1 hypothetical protein OHA_1_00197 [Pleomorphomonas sp. SM30]GLS77379.1 hypothetical protein GCM10007904_27160 [Oharaeibacter diazotrophicus]
MNQRTFVAEDGSLRRAFTVADVRRMVEAGVIEPDERLEIVDGELRPMSPKGPLHETLKRHLNRHLARELPDAFGHIQEAGWAISDLLYLEPDFLVFPAELEIGSIRGPDAALVIEVADSSWRYDAVRKAQIYASIGVREYWVIQAADRTTRVHRDPDARGYGSIVDCSAADLLVPAFVPGYSVRLRDLPGM